jgi:adhesin transport system outer membrane protein
LVNFDNYPLTKEFKLGFFMINFQKLGIENIHRYLLCWAMLLYSSLAISSPVGLEELLQEAVAYHPDILSKKGDVNSAGFNLEGAEWGRWPSVSVQVQSANSNNTVSRSTMGLLRVEQPLWTGGRVTSQIGVANANVGVANASLIESEQNVLLQASSAFFEVLRLEARLKAALDNEAEHRRLAESMKRRVKSEINPVADFIQVSTRMRQAITDRIEIERALASAKSVLQQWVGKRVDELTNPGIIPLYYKTKEEFIEAGLQFAPERKRLLAEVEVADAQISLAKSQMMPTVVAGYQTRLDTPGPGEERDRIYFAVQVQPGAGLSSLSGVSAAEAHKQSAQNAVYAYERQLTQELDTVWQQRQALKDQLAPKRSSVKGEDALVESYQRQFQVGKKTWIELLNSQQERTQAYYALADLEAPLQLTTLKLLLLTGYVNAKSTVIKND